MDGTGDHEDAVTNTAKQLDDVLQMKVQCQMIEARLTLLPNAVVGVLLQEVGGIKAHRRKLLDGLEYFVSGRSRVIGGVEPVGK